MKRSNTRSPLPSNTGPTRRHSPLPRTELWLLSQQVYLRVISEEVNQEPLLLLPLEMGPAPVRTFADLGLKRCRGGGRGTDWLVERLQGVAVHRGASNGASCVAASECIKIHCYWPVRTLVGKSYVVQLPSSPTMRADTMLVSSFTSRMTACNGSSPSLIPPAGRNNVKLETPDSTWEHQPDSISQ